MSWPLSQDYNEAIQSPRISFSDAELRAGDPVLNALGIPIPRSGNFADVYEFRSAAGGHWAIKCFTREVSGLRERYAAISRHLAQAQLPFTVDFTFLEQGIRVGGRWYPVLKMQWVEGLTLNEFVRQYADKPPMLKSLLQIWARMAARLREVGIAHADLQHGNVLLVPGSTANSLAVKLVDYDGMFVPALAGSNSGEIGHPCYQHPQRLAERTYSLEVDRFPLLLVATALDCIKVGGRMLWDKYDTGDNLLFREADLQAPVKSPLFYELLKLSDERAPRLVTQTLDALKGRLESVPLLEELLPELHAPAAPKPAAKRTTVLKAAAGQPAAETTATDSVWNFDGEDKPRSQRRQTKTRPRWVWRAVGGGVVALVLVGGLFALAFRGNAEKPIVEPRIAQNEPAKPPRPPAPAQEEAAANELQPEPEKPSEEVASPSPAKPEMPETPSADDPPSPPSSVSSDPAEVLTPVQAASKVGQKATVEFRVQQTGVNGAGFVELYSEPAWDRDGNFFIRFPESTRKTLRELGIPDVARHFHGKLIRVTGTVTILRFGAGSYPCIVIEETGQILAPTLPTAPKTDPPEPPRPVVSKETPEKAGPSPPSRAQGNRPPPDPKEVAAKAYEKACAEARAKLLKGFDTAIDQVAKRNSSTEKKLKLTDMLKEEKSRFENNGLIPWSEPMRPHLDRYLAVLSLSGAKLRRTYNSLIDAQLRAKNERMVDLLRAELKNRLDIRVLGKWRNFTNGRGGGIITLYSDGKINNSEGKATWSFAKGVLIYRWPGPNAPGGAWIHTLNVAADGMTYTGTNNDRPDRRPKFSGVNMKDN